MWENVWAGGAVGEVEDGSHVRVVREVPRYRNGGIGLPFWIVNISPRHQPELTLPEASGSREEAKAGAEAWVEANVRLERPRDRKVWRRFPNQPD